MKISPAFGSVLAIKHIRYGDTVLQDKNREAALTSFQNAVEGQEPYVTPTGQWPNLAAVKARENLVKSLRSIDTEFYAKPIATVYTSTSTGTSYLLTGTDAIPILTNKALGKALLLFMSKIPMASLDSPYPLTMKSYLERQLKKLNKQAEHKTSSADGVKSIEVVIDKPRGRASVSELPASGFEGGIFPFKTVNVV